MAERDKLEIIAPTGAITFYELDGGKGLTNIGRHPENDVVLDGVGIAPFHAVLDHRGKPYQFILLDQNANTSVNGQPIQANKSQALHSWNTIEVDGYAIILVHDGAANGIAPPPSDASPPAASVVAATPIPRHERLDTRPPDASDVYIELQLSADVLTVSVAEEGHLSLDVTNNSELAADFEVTVAGIEREWVAISPPLVNLLPGQSAHLQIEITPPRLPDSLAGAHYFAVIVTSPQLPGRHAQCGGVLNVNPYYEYAVSELAPKSLKMPWWRRRGTLRFSLTNYGNAEDRYQLDAYDDFRQCQFEFQLPDSAERYARRADIVVPPGETRTVDVHVAPYERRLVATRRRFFPVAITTSPLSGAHTPRSVVGKVYGLPLIGPFVLALLAVALLAGGAFISTPRIQAFGADSALIESGQTSTLRWRASPFARLRLEPDIGAVEGPEGFIEVSPEIDTIYTLTAENILSWVYPDYFRDSRMTAVFVDGILPGIEFFSDTETIAAGDSVRLWWEVSDAERLILTTDGAPEIIPEEFHTGSRTVSPAVTTTYALRAYNRYTTDEGIVAAKTIQVIEAAPTAAAPQAAIERFDITPVLVSSGEEITIAWDVTGVDTVDIAPLGTFPPSGSVTHVPDQTTVFVLRASNGDQDLTLVRRVVVEPSSTATPEPGAPVILSFTATPSEVAAGSPEAENVLLQWSVQGPTTNVELSGASLGRITGLADEGTWLLSAGETSVVTLTAANGGASASSSLEVSVVSPIPTLSSISPNYSTDVGGAGISLNVSGSGFVPGSTVRWNGTDRSTSYSSTTQLSAVIPAADFAAASVVSVSVFNPPPGGGESNVVTFTIEYPKPSLTSLSPSAAPQGSNDISVALFGANFVNGAVVRWNGADRATTYVGKTQLIVVIPAADLASAGLANVSVFNPAPGGGESGALPFTIGALTATASQTSTATPNASATPTVSATASAIATATQTATATP